MNEEIAFKPPLETALQYDKAMKFWRKVEIQSADECWPWIGASSGGYGRFGVHGRAHRLAYELYYDTSISSEFFCCHNCDNPICCNPQHLFVGTPGDNSQDMWEKGRALKLIDQKLLVLQLHREGNSIRGISRELGVSRDAVRNLVTRYKDE